jgi:hypothetical protein
MIGFRGERFVSWLRTCAALRMMVAIVSAGSVLVINVDTHGEGKSARGLVYCWAVVLPALEL